MTLCVVPFTLVDITASIQMSPAKMISSVNFAITTGKSKRTTMTTTESRNLEKSLLF